MAVYSYRCTDCGLDFDKFGKPMAESAKAEVCPECKGRAVRTYSSDVLIII